MQNHGVMIKAIAINHGYDAQSRQLIEEMAELTKAINKFWRKQLQCGDVKLEDVPFDVKERRDILEEVADVQVMLEQMVFLLGANWHGIKLIMDGKIRREMKRITEGPE